MTPSEETSWLLLCGLYLLLERYESHRAFLDALHWLFGGFGLRDSRLNAGEYPSTKISMRELGYDYSIQPFPSENLCLNVLQIQDKSSYFARPEPQTPY